MERRTEVWILCGGLTGVSCRSALWWSLPHESWRFRSVKSWSSSSRSSHSLRKYKGHWWGPGSEYISHTVYHSSHAIWTYSPPADFFWSFVPRLSSCWLRQKVDSSRKSERTNLNVFSVLKCFTSSFFRQILLIGGSNPIEDVEKFKEKGYVTVTSWKCFIRNNIMTCLRGILPCFSQFLVSPAFMLS